MGSITKGFIGGLATAAQANFFAPAQAKRFSFGVYDFIVPFHTEGPVGGDHNFCWHVPKVAGAGVVVDAVGQALAAEFFITAGLHRG